MTFAGVRAWVRRAAHDVFLLGVLALAGVSSGQVVSSVTVAWDPSPDPSVTSYNVYYGLASRSYTIIVPVPSGTSTTLSGLVPGNTYYFAATSLTAAGLESDFSTEVSYTMPANGTNVPPTLDPISDIAFNENSGLQTVALTGISSGSPSEVQTLTVNAFSSNPSLVPNPTVLYTSPNPTGSLTFTPAANSYGNVTMTVMVDDGGVVSNTVIRTFNITVAPVNAPPTLDAISDLSINENTGLQSVPLTGIGTGAPNEIQTLTVTAASSNPALISAPAVYYTSPGATGRVSFTPVANAYGVATVTVTVSDGQPTNNLTSRSFNVTVNQTTNAAQPQAWTLWWQHSTGKLAGWSMLGTNRVSGSVLTPSDVGTSWKIAAAGDLDGDGQEDLIFESTTGQLVVWLMNGHTAAHGTFLNPRQVDPTWQVVATGDMDGDGRRDILFERTDGSVMIWLMNGTNVLQQTSTSPSKMDPSWRIVGTGDFNGDGQTDIVLQSKTGSNGVWLMNGTNVTSFVYLTPSSVDPAWKIVGVRDLDGDGQPDLLLQHTSGYNAAFLMTGTHNRRFVMLNPPTISSLWKIVGPQ